MVLINKPVSIDVIVNKTKNLLKKIKTKKQH